MPPKFKFTKAQIVDRAVTIVRNDGWGGLTTRALARALGSSARPIYSFFDSITELEEEIIRAAVSLLYEYMTQERTGDPWHDHGIGYVIFDMDEKHLFRCMNDEKHITLFKKYGDHIRDACTELLSDYAPFQRLSPTQVYQIQLQRWLFAHGLAFSASNPAPDTWTLENVIPIMQSGSKAIYTGLLDQFQS